MIVIESGGTKSTWVFKSESEEINSVQTVGLHPQELSVEKRNIIQSLIGKHNFKTSTVYFYGAGCESKEAKAKIISFFKDLGLNIKQVQTDIYAACLAHLGNKKGIVGILGTGAVAAKFDGEKVIQQTSGLGYLLGDEGSGYDIGKRLLQKYFKEELPFEISEAIEIYFNNESILHRIHEPDGRMCIAGLTKVIHQFSNEPSIKVVLVAAFSGFCDTALQPFERDLQIHFVGSIAYYFTLELKEELLKAGYDLGEVKKEAVFGVFDYLSSISKC